MFQQIECVYFSPFIHRGEPHSSVGSVGDFKTAGGWFDPRFDEYSFRKLMIVIAIGFIPLSPLYVVSTMVMWQITSGLERILCGELDKRTPGKHG